MTSATPAPSSRFGSPATACRAGTDPIDESRRYELVTFDVYTALTDLEVSLVPPLQKAIESHEAVALVAEQGHEHVARELLAVWRAKQLEYALTSNSMGSRRVPFCQITWKALLYAAQRFGIDLDEHVAGGLVESWNRLDLWPEAAAVVGIVVDRGYRVAVLSNGDREMLTALIEHTGLPFELIFSAEEAGAYKPDPAVYALPVRQLGMHPERILHVAGSATDTMGAKAARLACAWSNRQRDKILDPGLEPDFELEDLNGLREVI